MLSEKNRGGNKLYISVMCPDFVIIELIAQAISDAQILVGIKVNDAIIKDVGMCGNSTLLIDEIHAGGC